MCLLILLEPRVFDAQHISTPWLHTASPKIHPAAWWSWTQGARASDLLHFSSHKSCCSISIAGEAFQLWLMDLKERLEGNLQGKYSYPKIERFQYFFPSTEWLKIRIPKNWMLHIKSPQPWICSTVYPNLFWWLEWTQKVVFLWFTMFNRPISWVSWVNPMPTKAGTQNLGSAEEDDIWANPKSTTTTCRSCGVTGIGAAYWFCALWQQVRNAKHKVQNRATESLWLGMCCRWAEYCKNGDLDNQIVITWRSRLNRGISHCQIGFRWTCPEI